VSIADTAPAVWPGCSGRRSAEDSAEPANLKLEKKFGFKVMNMLQDMIITDDKGLRQELTSHEKIM